MRHLIGLLCLASALANWDDTSTGIDLNKFQHPKLTKVRAGTLIPGQRIKFDGIEAAMTPDGPGWPEVTIRGRGKSGMTWTVRLCGTCFNEVWRADLDGNGKQDYVIFGVGPYHNGRNTPLNSMSFLLMDSAGMPVPFFTVIYHGEGAINNLIELDGKVRLLISRYDEAGSDRRVGAFCSGHWVTQLYGFTNGTVEAIRGTFGNLRFPFIHDWTYYGAGCSEGGNWPTQPPEIWEGGTSAKGALSTRLRTAAAIEPVGGCTSAAPEVVLFDSPAGRQIDFPMLYDDPPRELLLTAIAKSGAAVELRGITSRDGFCYVSLMWARSTKQH